MKGLLSGPAIGILALVEGYILAIGLTAVRHGKLEPWELAVMCAFVQLLLAFGWLLVTAQAPRDAEPPDPPEEKPTPRVAAAEATIYLNEAQRVLDAAGMPLVCSAAAVARAREILRGQEAALYVADVVVPQRRGERVAS